jgi:2-C-methyl-D-erythritol 4-phosphate cytidylyltransferase
MKTTFSIIVPAAGKGLRMGLELPKQYLELNGTPILEITLRRLWQLQPKSLCLVVGEDDRNWSLPSASSCQTAKGGLTRAESVLAGLIAMNLDPEEMVLVHDAVRPLFRHQDVIRLIESVGSSEHGGLLATPVIDTLKEASAAHTVIATPDRSRLWQAQTPQIFRAGLLHEALAKAIDANIEITDEASALEALGYQPQLIEGSRDNIKITTKEDLAFAHFILEHESGSAECE